MTLLLGCVCRFECRQQNLRLSSHRELSPLVEMPNEIPTGSMGVRGWFSWTKTYPLTGSSGDRLWVQRPTTEVSETPIKKGKKGGKTKPATKTKKEDPPRQTLSSQSGQASRAARARARAMGTRLSSRLRRGEGDPEWQEPPEEWLQDGGKKPKEGGKGPESVHGPGSIFNADSDLTDISDNEQVVPPDRKSARKVVTSDNEEDTPFGSGSLTEIDDEKEKEVRDEAGGAKEELSEEKTLDPKDPNFIELETVRGLNLPC